MKKGLFGLCLLFLFNSALAGSKGYTVVFIDLTPKQLFKPLFLKYREETNFQNLSRCWQNLKGDWIDLAYVNKQPIQMSNESIKKAARQEQASVKKLATLLKQSTIDDVSGFDGIYIVIQENDRYEMVGISNDASFQKFSSLQPESIKSLDKGLCVVSSAFDKNFNL